MLGKGIDTTPDGDNGRVEEFLASASPSQPELSHKQQDSHHNSIRNERTSHDEMRKTLAKMIVATEPIRRNPTKQYLRPADERHRFSDHTVRKDKVPTDPALETLFEVKFQVHAERDLDDQHEHQNVGE